MRLPTTATAPLCPSEVRGIIPIEPGMNIWRRLYLILGPGLLVSIGYIDPGNWETGIEAASQYGYQLMWLVVLACLAAMLIQFLCCKLGIVTRQDLALTIRNQSSPALNIAIWFSSELAIIATDVAEVLGTALALQLLFKLPLLVGIAITSVDMLLVLGLKGRNFRLLEIIILSMLLGVMGCFVASFLIIQPNMHFQIAHFIPSGSAWHSHEFAMLAVGIIGATIMPHNLYLHSSIVQTRVMKSTADIPRHLRYSAIDTIAALFVAMLINLGLMTLIASIFHYGQPAFQITSIQDVYHMLTPAVGSVVAPILFAVALLLAGQSATITGTIAGQAVLEGHLQIKIPCYQRRLITRGLSLIPAFLGIAYWGEGALPWMLLMSQTILGLQLPLVLFPLIRFTSRQDIMGQFKNSRYLTLLCWLLFSAIVMCNIWLVIKMVSR